jgi:TonB family protein
MFGVLGGRMNKKLFSSNSFQLKLAAVRLFQAAALALVVMLAIPAGAADDRAVKTRVSPIYPDLARRMKISGMVTVEATVDAGGKVSEAKTIGGNRLLAPAAEDAVLKWRFVPGPGTSKVNVSVNFAMNQ